MWSVIDLYFKYPKAETVYICGTGKSLEKFKADKQQKNSVVIAINRAIYTTAKKTDLLFVDRPHSLHSVKKDIPIGAKIVMPVWSDPPGIYNFLHDLYPRFKDRTYFYNWGYLNYRLLGEDANYPLDLIQLFIGWGTANSALHFTSRLKNCKHVVFYGCSGYGYDSDKNISARKKEQYCLCRKYLDEILKVKKLSYEFK